MLCFVTNVQYSRSNLFAIPSSNSMFCVSPWCWDPWIPETWQQRSNGSICMYEQVNFSDISAVQIARKTLNIFCSREILWNDRLHWIDWLMRQSRKGFDFERFWTEHWRYNIRRVTQLWQPLALESLRYEVTVSRVAHLLGLRVPVSRAAHLLGLLGMWESKSEKKKKKKSESESLKYELTVSRVSHLLGLLRMWECHGSFD